MRKYLTRAAVIVAFLVAFAIAASVATSVYIPDSAAEAHASGLPPVSTVASLAAPGLCMSASTQGGYAWARTCPETGTPAEFAPSGERWIVGASSEVQSQTTGLCLTAGRWHAHTALCDGRPDQQWTWPLVAGGWQLRSSDGKCLDVTARYKVLSMRACQGAQWALNPVP